MPMKLAYITSFPVNPSTPRGGVEAVSVTLVGALAGLEDLAVHVVTMDPDCRMPTQTYWNNVTIHRLPWAGRKMLSYALGEGGKLLRRYVTNLQPNIVHAHDTYGLMVRGLSFPRVFTIHGFIHADTLLAGGRFPRLRSWVWRWFETRAWADQAHIISISPYVRQYLGKNHPAVIHDIENPIREDFFSIDRREEKNTIFSAALICRRKNTLGLLKAFNHLIEAGTNATLRVAGAVAENDYHRLVLRYVEEHHLTDRVTFPGPLSSEQIKSELARAAIFSLVSLEEGAPLCVEEAMAAGVPVVASNRCGMPFMVQDNRTGFLVDPSDPHDIASRFGQLLKDNVLRETMSRQSREVALSLFHPPRVALKTREVYGQAIRSFQEKGK